MKTLIIDGNNLIHRTYWVAKLQSKGDDDNIGNLHIYFTFNSLLHYVTRYSPDKTVVVWDKKLEYVPNERKAEFGEYKGNRSSDSTPHQNSDDIIRMLGYLGIASIYPRQYEADDIVSYMCRFAPGKKVIVSVDKDFLQLINSDVCLYDPIRKVEYNSNNFSELTEYPNTNDWLVAKCLTGDKSDNVPGIYKFGKVKVKKFLSGDLKLNEEEQSIFDRNMKLFNLSNLDYNHEESAYYREQLGVETTINWKEFMRECKERSLNQIINNSSKWHSTFCMDDTLIKLFG
jgi:5'-3' exonuclease